MIRSAISTFFGGLLRAIGLGGRGPCEAFKCAPFATAFVALAAKMAKADGVAMPTEAEAFGQLLDIRSPAERERVRRVYDLAKANTDGFEIYAARIADMLRDEPELKNRVLESLLHVACADGVLHPKEDEFLRTVARTFGMDNAAYRRVRAAFVSDKDDPFEILGVDRSMSRAAIKARYHKLVSDLHPDLLIAAGAPPTVISAATAKLASINSAYEEILAGFEKGVPA